MTVRPCPTLGFVVVAGMSVWALQFGDSAFMWAAQRGNVEAMALLLDRGADLETKGSVSPSAAPPACRPAGVV